MKNDLPDKIRAELAEKRSAAEERAYNALISARRDAEFCRLDDEFRGLAFDLEKVKIKGADTSALEAAKEAAEVARLKRLAAIGGKIADFEPEYACKRCNDTGTEEMTGAACVCTESRYLELVATHCALGHSAPYRFKDFKSSVCGDETHKKQLLLLKKYFEGYVQKFPDVKFPNIVLIGETGVGKSFLISAAANALVEKGVFVKYVTAFEFSNTALTYHTSPLNARGSVLEDILNFDVLIIDDLGSEPMLKNVTCEYLYLVLSERAAKNLAVIIATNLSVEDIGARYGERVYSRLTDVSRTKRKEITGKDLRVTRGEI
ncbi:MAG: ATP-binding protein [Clostridiaceae bacterium]|jgi:DNA replication protein DnaC|nr:ATP-binding protein [Clostridiaceae bacterium]